ncbi:MAG: hypothetical protein KDK64_02435 [Chlamydiia bacterium]|nr:hypothetical protein [Chlamydiia bacterium]
MSLDVRFHNFIDRHSPLKTPTQYVERKAKENPFLFKGVVVMNHLFRALSMWAFLKFHKASMNTKVAFCFAGSLGYRLTIETKCAYKFALPSFAGAVAFLVGKESLPRVINGAAFKSIKSLGNATLNLAPLTGYMIYIILTTSYDVDNPRCGCP